MFGNFRIVLVVSGFFLTLSTNVFAQAAAEPEEKVVTGVIASQGNAPGNTPTSIDSASEAPGDEAGVITGSIERRGSSSCQAILSNNSKKNSYSVSFAVIGKDARGSQVLKRTYSATIKAQQSLTREVNGCAKGLSLSVLVSSARKL
ncbi:MAG: hypothetical protein IT292_06995 [Deltaproteobacteria bacterium]|nr:hypothetical protein [Deltaproteobacteria bacterium]